MLDNTYIFMGMIGVLGSSVYALFIRPINRRYKRALDRLLAKEIARQMYQSLHPAFTYDNKYRPDDLNAQLILSSAIEEFNRLTNQTKENVQ